MNIKVGQKIVLKDGRFIGVVGEVGSSDPSSASFVGQFDKDSQVIGFTESDVLAVVEFTQHSNNFVQKLIDLKNGLIQHSFVVAREGEPDTVAIVSFKALTRMNAEQARTKLAEAVTRWIIRTVEGKDAWAYSSQDFNIGDLAGCVEDPILMIEISAAGLEEFCVCTMDGGAMGWNYDTVLVDRDKLDEADVFGEKTPPVSSVTPEVNGISDPVPNHQPGPDSVWNEAKQ